MLSDPSLSCMEAMMNSTLTLRKNKASPCACMCVCVCARQAATHPYPDHHRPAAEFKTSASNSWSHFILSLQKINATIKLTTVLH